MANSYVKTLTVGGTPHDIKDEVARSAIVTLNDTKADKIEIIDLT